MILLLTLLFLVPQDCSYDERCGPSMCLTWQHARFVCEPKQYTVAVWDRSCLDKIELGEKSTMEAPVDDEGKPDMSKARVLNTPLTFTKGCQFKYEVRTR